MSAIKQRIFIKPPVLTFLMLIISINLFNCNPGKNRIEKPSDAPKPLTPSDAVKHFKLPDGFAIELVASEPLIHEPTGVCWDEKGSLYVCELHGYNLEGHLEIQEMNKKGVLDTTVQRVQAAEKYKKEAEKGTFGTVKRLRDTNGDGIMDKAEILADKLPPAYGICAARGGIILAGQKEIVFIADKDEDGKAEIIDTLFSGFQGGPLERGLNSPQWGPEGWIYFGRGWNGGKITGPYLKTPVDLPGSNFRIRSDGSAIEPITGSTHTIGHAFTEDGYSFFTNTWKHALYAIPIPWKYLGRNPHTSISNLEADASDFSIVFPVAPVHPWKLARSSQSAWKEFYDQYGVAESAAEGYFTSCCSPLIYQDKTFPSEFYGNLFVCEPAQCLVHRSIVLPQGTGLKVVRAESEKDKEFLTSSDSWFRPVSLAHAPDGSLFITDMYREIIEDYSAVPRFMQQKYGVYNGSERGRIWRVYPTTANSLKDGKRVELRKDKLQEELSNPHYWIRQTANRLLYEKLGNNAAAMVANPLEIGNLKSTTPHKDFIHTLRTQDTVLLRDVALARKLSDLTHSIFDERILLQIALSLGYSEDSKVLENLVQLGRDHANIRWMAEALMTGSSGREKAFLLALLKQAGKNGHLMAEPLGESIALRGNAGEINETLLAIVKTNSDIIKASTLKGMNRGIKNISIQPKGKTALEELLKSKNLAVQGPAVELALKLKLTNTSLAAVRKRAIQEVGNVNMSTEQRLSAVALLSDAPDSVAGKFLIDAFPSSTPPIKSAILDALILKGNRISHLLAAFKTGAIRVNALSSLQRTQLLERSDSHTRPEVEAAFSTLRDVNKEKILSTYVKALERKGNIKNGENLFKQMCSSCHKVNNIGTAVGPDLKLAYKNSRETLLRNILWPDEQISSSYEIYVVTTHTDEKYSGVLVSESANAVVLRQAGGIDKTFFRKEIKNFSNSQNSLMPAFAEALKPEECSDIIEWLKSSLSVTK